MIRNLPGSFRRLNFSVPGVNGVVLLDGPDSSPGSQITPGASAIDRVAIQAPARKPWEVFGYSLEVVLYRYTHFLDSSPCYGKLGRLVGGVIPNIDDISSSSPLKIPTTALPFTSTVWDGENDPTPPEIGGTAFPTPGFVVPSSVSFPQPITVGPTQSLGIGLWLLPTVIANTAVYVSLASYLITYDDGF